MYGLQLKYTSGTSKECYAGLDGSGAFMSCGMGEASSADMIAEGGTATNQEGTTSYTVHHSNAMVRKYTIQSMSTTEFAAAYYMSYFVWVSSESKFYQYILQYNSDPLIFKIAYKRYHSGSGWTDFTADGTNTETLSSGEHGIQACWQNAKYYTGGLSGSSLTVRPTLSHYFPPAAYLTPANLPLSLCTPLQPISHWLLYSRRPKTHFRSRRFRIFSRHVGL